MCYMRVVSVLGEKILMLMNKTDSLWGDHLFSIVFILIIVWVRFIIQTLLEGQKAPNDRFNRSYTIYHIPLYICQMSMF